MGIQEAELRAQRMLTEAFINADSLEVTLNRTSMVSDGKGGFMRSTLPLPPQVMRMIPLADGSEERFTADGQLVRPTYMLMGTHEADVERFDTVTLGSGRYEVVFVNVNRQYQVKAEVAYRGQ